MFDEDQELFCIVAIIVFWILSFSTPLFLIPAVMLVLYICLDTSSKDKDDDEDLE